MTPDTILHLEKLALAAWPAQETAHVHGWALRAAQGFTKRANSANALAPEGDFAALRAAAEAFYRARGLPPVFRLTPLAPPEADVALAAAGYQEADPSRVMTAAARADSPPEVHVDEAVADGWLDGFAAANGVAGALRPLHDGMVRRIEGHTGFATLRRDGRALGYGLAVCAEGWVGLFDLVIASEARGQGLGRRLVDGLTAWGAAHGEDRAYLQVRDGNMAARRLYVRCGFSDAYAYRYRMGPPRALSEKCDALFGLKSA